MKEDIMCELLKHNNNSAWLSDIPIIPCSHIFDIMQSNIRKVDSYYYDKFDVVYFHNKDITSHQNWQELLVEIFNIGNKESVIISIKYQKNRDILLTECQKLCKSYEILDDYVNQKDKLNIIVLKCIRI